MSLTPSRRRCVPRWQQDWIFECLQGGRVHPLAACGVPVADAYGGVTAQLDTLPQQAAVGFLQALERAPYDVIPFNHSFSVVARCAALQAALPSHKSHLPPPLTTAVCGRGAVQLRQYRGRARDEAHGGGVHDDVAAAGLPCVHHAQRAGTDRRQSGPDHVRCGLGI